MSKSDNNIKYINNKLNIELTISSFLLSPKKKTSFMVHVILDMDSNDFEVEFLNATNQSLDAVSLERIAAFKTYCSGINPLSLYKDCGICKSYHYSSDINFDYDTHQVRSYQINYEYLNCIKDTNLGCKRYRLYNNYRVDKCTLIIELDGHADQMINASIIDITNTSDLLNQFEIMSVFS